MNVLAYQPFGSPYEFIRPTHKTHHGRTILLHSHSAPPTLIHHTIPHELALSKLCLKEKGEDELTHREAEWSLDANALT